MPISRKLVFALLIPKKIFKERQMIKESSIQEARTFLSVYYIKAKEANPQPYLKM